MNPRKLNQRIIIYKEGSGRDDYGEPEGNVEVLSCWASVRNKSGNEYFKTNTPYNKAVTSFLIRHRPDKKIDTTMTIEFNNDSYNIVYIDNYNYSDKWLEITAEKVK